MAPEPPEAGPELTELEAELIRREVSPAIAAELVRLHAEEKIRAQMERVDWLLKKQPGKIAEPAGYLVEAIKNDYAAPKSFVSAAELQRRREAKQAKERLANEERRRQREQEAREETERQAVEAHIKQLIPAERTALEAAALAEASPESRQAYDNPSMARFRDTFLLGLLRDHVRQLLRTRQAEEA